jgi:hypothetical protein
MPEDCFIIRVTVDGKVSYWGGRSPIDLQLGSKNAIRFWTSAEAQRTVDHNPFAAAGAIAVVVPYNRTTDRVG